MSNTETQIKKIAEEIRTLRMKSQPADVDRLLYEYARLVPAKEQDHRNYRERRRVGA